MPVMRIYLDTNIFVLAVEGRNEDPARDALWRLMSMSDDTSRFLVTSELSIAELLVKPLDLGLATVASTYCDIVANGGGLSVVPVDRSVLVLAAHIRKDDTSIKLPDAIHLATADREDCAIILTNDQQLTRKRPDRCRNTSIEAIDGIMRDLS